MKKKIKLSIKAFSNVALQHLELIAHERWLKDEIWAWAELQIDLQEELKKRDLPCLKKWV